ncbi:TolC family protein [Chitinophaga rhizophila]|uniref:TolC family protein n=1 Tax=Chitinophaga rhizophila TaxID=2866212 RepID=A0ABS7GFM6_9BACT|nr:TolC family protein [Chitinophaga rhizophila]MBW8686493.1 TolC family protein [Chitinophaga rhizophila]
MQPDKKHAGLTGLLLLIIFHCGMAQQQPRPPLQETISLSAKQAIDYALANQASVRNAKLDELIQLAKNKEVSGLALPTLAGSGTYQHNPIVQKQLIDAANFSDTVPKGTLVPFAFGLKHNAVGEVTLKQVLFDPSVLVALQARQTLEQLSAKTVQKSEIDVKVNVYKAYYNVLSARRGLEILGNNITNLNKLLGETRETYKNGLVEKLDVDRLVVQLTNLRTEETKLRNIAEVGIAALKYQMGMPIQQPIQLTDTLSLDEIKSALASEQFDYSQRIEYQLLQTQKRANEFDLKRYKLQKLPTLSLFGTGGVSRASDVFNYFSNETWYGYVSYGVNLSFTIFSGYQRRRKEDQAFLQLKKTEVSLEDAKLGIDMEQAQSTSNLRNNILTLEAQEGNMKLAEEVYNTTQIKYREGVGSSLEMSTAENELLTAQNNYFTALYNAAVSKVDYLKAYGKL